MKHSKSRLATIAISIWFGIWMLIGAIAIVYAASLLQTPNISTGEPAINRAVACSQTTVYCYAIGGGADSGTVSDVVHRYNRDTDTVDTVTSLPTDVAFQQVYIAGSIDDGRIIAQSGASVLGTGNTYIYTEASDSWQFVNPVGPTLSSGVAGGVFGDYLYLFTIISQDFSAYRMNLNQLGNNFSLVEFEASLGAFSLQLSKTVYDPIEQKAIVFMRDNGRMLIYDVVTNDVSLAPSLNTFPPCDSIASCQPSLAFYDADLGVVAGKQGDPGATSIGLYQWSWDNEDWSSATVETLSNANFNSQQFTSSNPAEGYSTTDGITETFFGSSRTFSASPGYNANQYWLRTGDPGGVTPVERDIDTWLPNFLESIGLNSAFGKLLAGVIFTIIIFSALAIREVPWVMSMGVSAMAGTFLTAALIFGPEIMLVMMALAGVGGIALIFALLSGGRDSA